MGLDYYNIPKVNRNASEDDLKKPYKRLVIIWHPDKNPSARMAEAEAKFKQISGAFDFLSDPQKRQIYDLSGEEALKSGQFPQQPPPSLSASTSSYNNRHYYQRLHPNPFFRLKPRDAEDIYEEFFGSESSTGGGNHRRGYFKSNCNYYSNGGEVKKVAAIENVLMCRLEDLYKDAKKNMRISRNVYDASSKVWTLEEILTIEIKPGWKKGTKITFHEKGNRKLVLFPQILFLW